ncbi:MAG: gliding motility-associated C-terminal domain-containing protein [Bacteroidia bacterium]|nr:gliding motility-associated C-terminal domain-containing protein [Bacteroidia bacterium]
MKKIFIATIIINSLVQIAYSQNNGTYVKSFNYPDYTGAHSVFFTQDGGFVIAGEFKTAIGGQSDMFVYKASACGNNDWFRSFGSSTNDRANKVKQHSSGGYILTGYYDDKNGTGSKQEISILKTDFFGNTIWHSTLNNANANDEDIGNDVLELSSGNFVVVGSTKNFPWSNHNAIFSSIAGNSGAMLFSKVIGNNGIDAFESIVSGNSNDVFLCGYTNSFGAGQFDLMLANSDILGNISWIKTYGTSGNEGNDKEVKCIRTPGGLLILSYTDNTSITAGGKDILLINVDIMGNVVWAKRYGGSLDDVGKSIIASPFGGYVITGYTYSFSNGDRDAFVMRIDNSGNLIWARSYGKVGCDYGTGIIGMGNGYILTMNFNNTLNTCSFNNEYDPMIIRLDSIGNSGCNSISAFFSSADVSSSIITNNINVSANSQDITANMSIQYPVPFSTNPNISEQFDCFSCSVPTPSFSVSSPSLCVGDFLILQNQSTGVSGGTCFQWNINNNIVNYKDTVILQPNAGSYYIQLNAICGNTIATYQQTVNVYPKPYSQFTFTNNVCFESLPTNYINVGSSGIGYIYQWYLGSGAIPPTMNTPNANNVQYAYPGIKNVALVITNPYGCKDSILHQVSIEPSPSVDFLVSKNPVCVQDTVNFINNSWIGSGSVLNNWYWDFGDGNTSNVKNPTHQYTSSGVYTVTLVGTSDYGCDDTAQYVINVDALTIPGNISPSFTTVCQDANLGTLILNGFNGNILYWKMSADTGTTWTVLSNTASIQGYYNLNTTIYYAAVVQNGACTPLSTPIATVQVDKKSNAGILSKDTVVCYGINNGTFVVSNYLSTILDWISYDETNGYQSLGVTTSTYAFTNLLDTTKYAVIVKNGVCPADTSNFVTVYVQKYKGAVVFPTDTTISLGFSIQIQASGGSSYLWFPSYNISDSTIFNPYVWPYKDTVYTVIVKNQYGCMDTASVRFKVLKDYKLIIANTMTPNGDNFNDFFWIGMIEYYPNNEVLVFNRYGQMIFNGKNYDNKKVYWDGTYQGNKVPDGAYYYVIKFTDSNVIFKGSINVISSN